MNAKEVNNQLRKRNDPEGKITVICDIKRQDMEDRIVYPGEIYTDGEEAFRCVENLDGGCSRCVFKNGRMLMGLQCTDMKCWRSDRDDGLDVYFEKVDPLVSEERPADACSPSENVPSKEEEASSESVSEQPKQYSQIMKDMPFDIEMAKKGYKVVTRDGRLARILSYDFENQEYPIVAAIKKIDEDGQTCEEIQIYTSGGHYGGPNPLSPLDLKIRCYMYSGWTNVYKADPDISPKDHIKWDSDLIFPTKEEALEMRRTAGYLATVPIEWPVSPEESKE